MLSATALPPLARSVLSNYTHHEPVQKLVWIRDTGRGAATGGYMLASVSADGKLLVWTPDQLSHPALGFQLLR